MHPSSSYEDRLLFSSQQELQRVLHWWWIISLMALLGALCGWIIHAYIPPVYEAQAVFSATIDYTQTGMMTQFEQDQALNAVGHLIASGEVLDRVVAQSRTKGMSLTVAELRRMGTVERQVDAFILRLRTVNAERAAYLANLWAGEANALINDAQAHALQAAHLARYLQSLESCLQRSLVIPPAPTLCYQRSPTEIQNLITETSKQLQAERQASRNLFPGLLIQWVEEATPPTQPTQFGRNDLMLAGALIGLLVGIISVEVLPPFRRITS